MASRRRLRAEHAFLAALPAWLASLAPATAQANSEVVVQLTVPDRPQKAVFSYQGYVEPIPNALLNVKPFDPLPECVVYLEGEVPPEATKPTAGRVALELGTASFRVPVVAVVAGSTIEVSNVGKTTHPIYSPNLPDFEGSPIGPTGKREVQMKDAGKSVLLMSRESPHVRARLVALGNRYFARVGRDGKFHIPDVPNGTFTVHVWFRDAALGVTASVEVGPKLKPVSLALPDGLAEATADAPAAAPAASKPSPPAAAGK